MTPGEQWQPFGSLGCVTCGTQSTVVMSGTDGRRCAAHAEHLPDMYRRDVAMELVDAGRAFTALQWLRTHLTNRSTRA